MLQILKHHTILYAEDEPDIQANISEYLRHYFKEVYLAADGAEALRCYRKHQPDALLLDINIPSVDGLTLAAKIRAENPDISILMLTAHTEKTKLLAATELKLTKYLIKPGEPKYFKEALTLLAHELSRKQSRYRKIGDDCFWDTETRTLTHHETPVTLTAKEQKLLELFLEKRGKTVHYPDIMVTVWEDALDKEISVDSVKNLVSKLRKKLPACDISSVYGVGYMLK